MIRGRVTDRAQAIVPLRLRGPSGVEMVVEAIVDTGFDDTLTLPGATVASLGLIFDRAADLTLADSSVALCEKHMVEVEWDGVWRRMLAWSFGDHCIMGMLFLAGHRLAIDVKAGGVVEITSLP